MRVPGEFSSCLAVSLPILASAQKQKGKDKPGHDWESTHFVIHCVDKLVCVDVFLKYRIWEKSAGEHPRCSKKEKEEKNQGQWQLNWDIWG